MKVESGTAYATTATDAYGEGYAAIERATRLDHDAAAAVDERTRNAARAEAALSYEDALRAFERAVVAEPTMYEAHTYIGYANRKLGRHELALAAYEKALDLKPDYSRAIEYQGEAFLGLDNFDATKRNYMRLYALDAEQADKLLRAMHVWAEERRHAPGQVPQDQLQRAAAWLATRPMPTATHANEPTPW